MRESDNVVLPTKYKLVHKIKCNAVNDYLRTMVHVSNDTDISDILCVRLQLSEKAGRHCRHRIMKRACVLPRGLQSILGVCRARVAIPEDFSSNCRHCLVFKKVFLNSNLEFMRRFGIQIQDYLG